MVTVDKTRTNSMHNIVVNIIPYHLDSEMNIPKV